MTKRLFSLAALRYQATDSAGKPRLASPPAASLTIILLLCTVLIAAMFAASQTYPKKSKTYGFVHVDEHRISVESTGVIEFLQVKQGDSITEGQVIGRVGSTRSEYLRQDLISEDLVNTLSNQKQLLIDEYKINKQALGTAISQSRSSLSNITSLQNLQRGRIERTKRVTDRTRPLWQKGFVSDLQWSGLEDQLLVLQQQKIDLEQRRATQQTDINELVNKLSMLNGGFQLALSAQHEKALLLESSLQDRKGNLQETLYAPLSGVVNNLFKHKGDRVLAAETILTISTGQKPLHARILISSEMSGQIVSGQQVHMRMHAFPHTTFGTLKGEILSISPYPVSAIDLPHQLHQPGKFYIGLVSLPRLSTNPESFKLKPGMTFSADVILGERNLYALIFEPLLDAAQISGMLSE
jgi:membrane fusion protein